MSVAVAAEPLADVNIESIKIGDRIRRDYGDIQALAESIEYQGLLQPILIDSEGKLVCGYRRLLAHQLLGVQRILARIVDLPDLLRAEIDENACRKQFTPAEWVAIHDACIEQEREAAAKREKAGKKIPSANFAQGGEKGKAIEKVARGLGISHETLRKAVEIAHKPNEPALKPEHRQKFAELAAKLEDKTQKVDPLYKDFKALLEEVRQEPPSMADVALPEQCRIITCRVNNLREHIDAGSVDCIITDPPYPKEFLEVYQDLAALAAYALKPGGSLLAMVGQSYLPRLFDLLEHDGLTYQWTFAYMTPGSAGTQHHRRVNTSWKPVLWFVKGEYTGKYVGDVFTSDRNDKRFHHWGQSEGGMSEIVERFSYPGDCICDPFLGGGTTAVVAYQLGRRFVGCDIDETAVETTERRIKEALG